MRPSSRPVAGARALGETLPERVLGTDALSRIEASCPGNTYMPPECAGDPHAVVERWVAEAELTGETDAYLGKRQHPRFTWDVVVLVRVCTGRLKGKIIRARTFNVSLGGMGVRVRSMLEAGVTVEIMVEGRPHGVRGQVVHCTRTMTGNLLGVCFDLPA